MAGILFNKKQLSLILKKAKRGLFFLPSAAEISGKISLGTLCEDGCRFMTSEPILILPSEKDRLPLQALSACKEEPRRTIGN